MSLRWFLVIFALVFIASFSGFSRADFLPKTNLGRGIAAFLLAIIFFLLGATIWTVLPFVLGR